MKTNKKNMLLYAITDRHWLAGRTLASQVEEVLAMVQPFYNCVKNILDIVNL